MSKRRERKLRLERASVAYHTPEGIRHVLRGIDLDIAAGEWIAIVGRNGSGKSTLARVLSGLCPLSAGSLETVPGTRTQLVFQNPEAQLVGETVFEDIAFGLENEAVDPKEMRQRAVSALEQVGLQVSLGRPARELSGGQKQLLAAAGCIALQPDVLIWDESTSMLDPVGRARVMAAARSLHLEGVAIIWVTQLLEELAAAERIVALEDGAIVYEGSNHGFFYNDEDPSGAGPCERYGFTPPFAVQVAKRLMIDGHSLEGRPIAAADLHEAVAALCRS